MRWMMRIAVLCTVPAALAAQEQPHTPAVGTPERAAILDAVRPTVQRAANGRVRFADVRLSVVDGWAYLRAVPYSWKAGYYGYQWELVDPCERCDAFVFALMRREAAGWRLVASQIGAVAGTSPLRVWAAAHGPPAALFTRDPDEAALEAAMREYIDALAARDRQRWLALFPRAGPIRFVNNITQPPYEGTATTAELRQDLLAEHGQRDDWWFGHVDPETGEKEHDYYAERFDAPGMWRRDERGLYVDPWDPLQEGGRVRSYVRWKKEAGHWVIAEIGYVAA